MKKLFLLILRRLEAGEVLLRFLVLTLGGIGAGLLVGLAGRLALRFLSRPILGFLVTVSAAYLSYQAASLVGGSGVVGTVAAGIAMATASTRLINLWDPVSVTLNAVLFVILGLQFPTREVIGLGWLVPAAFGVMLLSRLLPVYGLLQVADPRVAWIPWNWRHLVFWSGMRGGLSIALALSLMGLGAVDARIAPAAYGVVVLSLLVQGGLLWPVARVFGLSGSGPPSPGEQPTPGPR